MSLRLEYLFWLGTHVELAAAEAWRVLELGGYEPELVSVIEPLLHVRVTKPVTTELLTELGGTLRIAQVMGQETNFPEAARVAHLLSPTLPALDEKMTIGISAVNVATADVRDLGRSLKQWARAEGRRLRFITPPRGRLVLSAAAVRFNDLLLPPNSEVILVGLDHGYMIGQTVAVQDIAAYTQRDTDRPARDPRMGMLPPKLAQILLNFGRSLVPSSQTGKVRILDPFCGVGTVVQEGWLLGAEMMGSDREPRMIQAATKNMGWLERSRAVETLLRPRLIAHDATRPFPRRWGGNFSAMVSEPFLGKPLKQPLSPQQLTERIEELGTLYERVFKNLHPVLKRGGVVVMVLPAFRETWESDTFYLFPQAFLDAIERLGYSPVQLMPEPIVAAFGELERGDLVYARPDALVGREVRIWRRAL